MFFVLVAVAVATAIVFPRTIVAMFFLAVAIVCGFIFLAMVSPHMATGSQWSDWASNAPWRWVVGIAVVGGIAMTIAGRRR